MHEHPCSASQILRPKHPPRHYSRVFQRKMLYFNRPSTSKLRNVATQTLTILMIAVSARQGDGRTKAPFGERESEIALASKTTVLISFNQIFIIN